MTTEPKTGIDLHTFGDAGIYVILAKVMNETATTTEIRKISRYIDNLRTHMYEIFYDKPKNGFLYNLFHSHIKKTAAELQINYVLRPYVINAAIASLRDIALRGKVPERIRSQNFTVVEMVPGQSIEIPNDTPELVKNTFSYASPVMFREHLIDPAKDVYAVAMDMIKPYNADYAYFWEFKDHDGVYCWSEDSKLFSIKNLFN